MMTERPHPRHAAGLPRVKSSSPSAFGGTGFKCGDIVHDKDDERHYARVIAIISNTVRVRWLDTDWTSDIDCRDLVKVAESPDGRRYFGLPTE